MLLSVGRGAPLSNTALTLSGLTVKFQSPSRRGEARLVGMAAMFVVVAAGFNPLLGGERRASQAERILYAMFLKHVSIPFSAGRGAPQK